MNHQAFSSIDRQKDISLLTGLLRIDVSPLLLARMIIISEGEEGKVHLALLHSFLESRSNFHDKKERFVVFNKTAPIKMLPELYLTTLESQLSASQLLSLEMLVWLLQFHALESESNWLRDLMILRPNKRTFFQKGLRAMALIQADF